jgi:hypothetical protein
LDNDRMSRARTKAAASPRPAAANQRRDAALRRNPKRDRALEDLETKFPYAQRGRKSKRA